MPSEYTTKINKIAEVFDGPHATPKKIDSGPYFLSISSLEGGQLDLSKSAHLSDDEFKKWTRRVTPTEGDLLFSYETRLGEAALMPKNITACLGRRMGLLRPIREKVIPDYLLYAYLSPEFQCTITSRTIPGCTVNRIALKDLPNFPIRIPPLSEQRAVVAILKSIDDKINLNRQINQSLESMAQAIFKSWFVDFDPVKAKLAAIEAGKDAEGLTRAAMRAISGKTDDELDQMQAGQPENYARLKTTAELFPAAMQDSELGEVPEGWEVDKLKNHSNQIIRGFTTNYVEKSNLINLNQKVNRGSYLDKSNYKYYPEDTKVPEEKYAKKKDILINSLGQGTLGRVHLFWEHVNNIVIDQHITVIRTNCVSLYPEYLYNYLLQRGTQYRLESHVTGTTGMLMLNVSKIRDFPALVPDENIQRTFSSVVSDFHHQIYKNTMENEILSQIRDSLLPKLLSGELEVNAAGLEEEN